MKWHHFFYILSLILPTLLSMSSVQASSLESSLQKVETQQLWLSKEWQRLVIYRTKNFGGFDSFVDGGNYFLAADGKTNPKSELQATVASFYSLKPHKAKKPHGQCSYPARLSWFKRAVPDAKLPNVNCPELAKYRKQIKAKSVSVVFSSYYMNNPGSTFGHTFLRFNKITQGKKESASRNELLDMAFSYGANMPSSGGALANLGGLVGAFPGSLNALPYYFKVREYNDFEDRDLWSYELDLSEQEVLQLSNILWELGSAYIDYYFFDDNCAYIILAAIEAAAPRLNITERLRPWVIPADTIKVVARYPGLVRNIKYRSSIRRQLVTRMESLDDKSKKVLKELFKDEGKSELNVFLKNIDSEAKKADILDALTDYISFVYPKDLKKRDTKSYNWKRKILFERSSLPITEELNILPRKKEQPDLGHESMRMGLLAGGNKEEAIVQGEIRFAIHDVLDGELGFPRNSQVEFFNVKARQTKDEGLSLLDWAIVRVASYTPQDDIKTTTSFRMQLGARRLFDENCTRIKCVGGYFELGFGYSFRPFQGVSLVAYAFGDADINFSNQLLKSNLRVGLGPRTGLIYNQSQNLKFHLSHFHKFYPFAEFTSYNETELRGRWTQNDWLAWDLSASYRHNYGAEALLGAYVYF